MAEKKEVKRRVLIFHKTNIHLNTIDIIDLTLDVPIVDIDLTFKKN